MRRSILTALAALMLLTLTACGGQSETPPPPADEKAETPAPQEPQTPPEPTPEELAAREIEDLLGSLTLEELLRQIALGSQQAFEELYRATDSAIYGYALSLMRNHHEAQDIMMDTYLKIRCAAHLYMPMGKPMAWILTITKNIARTKLRSAGRQIPLDDLEETTPSFDRDSEEAVALEQAMKVLGDQERQILILHAVTGLKHREIAEMLGMPLATVLSKYARSLKKLKKALEEDNFPNKEVQ